MEGLIPHLACDGCRDAIAFYKKAFGAEELRTVPAPEGAKIMHCEMRLDGRPLFLVDDFPEFCDGK
jgi:PhnB protein